MEKYQKKYLCPEMKNKGLSDFENTDHHFIVAKTLYNEFVKNNTKEIKKSDIKRKILSGKDYDKLNFTTKNQYLNKSFKIMKDKFGITENVKNGEHIFTYNKNQKKNNLLIYFMNK
ncbi:MAG: hypothetical protein WC934_02125 [Acidithiobacillus sp.]|jgi:hypothetical protein|uniref:hypothetical protein n=1 Tax=Acidithiobacillus sp. TaxID=1872118 RepID=UPI00355E9B7F